MSCIDVSYNADIIVGRITELSAMATICEVAMSLMSPIWLNNMRSNKQIAFASGAVPGLLRTLPLNISNMISFH